ncbi:alpha-hydroxy-acid oxidizing enzyme [Kineosporia sp. NBRC 101677]|uniref:alpha-hydroxy acid oxidase n=1 Tax=Kineosporia sp. NBRC 101677 TaxID=3032197 RepID=UPI0024A3D380|nr:alpha-hydroxy acid oxidase [Kineosporia sp. NBRC 101677]GLY20215.1 alpha-hydroxy-acid oxidizing enzyme [Kineosporia sp. NBRC 101677]
MVAFKSVSTPELATLSQIRRTALSRLSPEVADFLEGGAGDETTLAANRSAFARWGFRQRVMSGLATPDISTALLGIDLAMPVLTSPFGADGLFHPEGQKAVARANLNAGIASIVPEAGTHALEDVAEAAPKAARIAQLHPMGPEANFRHMLHRIEDAGYEAICLTVDCPTGGWRERVLRNAFDLDARYVNGNYRNDGETKLIEVFGQLFERCATVWSWERLAGLMNETALPWFAKGIMTPEDALASEAAGAAAVYVSNHGGRQLDGVPAALDALIEVREVIEGRLPILFDSGVRRGADVVKALALGADVVVIGRLAAYGLAAGGQAGVERVHSLLYDEIRTVLTLLGRGGVDELGPDSLVRLGASAVSEALLTAH